MLAGQNGQLITILSVIVAIGFKQTSTRLTDESSNSKLDFPLFISTQKMPCFTQQEH